MQNMHAFAIRGNYPGQTDAPWNVDALFGDNAGLRFPRKSRHPTIRLAGRLEGCLHGSKTPYSCPMNLEFTGEIWHWRGPSPFHFITVPEEERVVGHFHPARAEARWALPAHRTLRAAFTSA